ncbi:MAG TPA: LPXTG cell wall anchor domain-containing protein [Thermoanaerobaculia bacterium]|jgi:LPXTG-motif cell wall-anchored protein|nr:LPXTG cell wall anchor domain-containing protein [Thermoanaerobaculia bacterium]
MKKHILILAMLALAMTAGLMAQSTSTSTSTLPPSQQVDQSGKPETHSGPDVDVDAGANAKNGVLSVDVDRNTDSDTAAEQGDRPANRNDLHNNQNPVATGTAATGNAVRDAADMDNDTTTTGGTYNSDTNTADDQSSLPSTGSEMPLIGLLGLIALAGAFVVRSTR